MLRDSAFESESAAGRSKSGLAAARRYLSGSFSVLAITLLIQAMVVAAVLAPTVIAPVVVRAFGLPDSTAGVYISLIYISAVCSTLYSGTLISRWGPIRVSQACLLLCGLGTGLIATGSVPLGLAGIILAGLGYGPVTPASSHILIRTTPPHRLSIVFSIKQTGVPVGGIAAGLLMPPQQLAFGWAPALLSVALGCAAMALVAQLVRRVLDDDRGEIRQQTFIASFLVPLRLIASQRRLRILTVSSFIFAGVQLSLTTYLSTYLNLSLGWTLLAAGVALSVAQGAGMIGRIVWGAVADTRFGPQKTLVLLNCVMIASCIATAIVDENVSRIAVFVVLAVFGASAVGWNGVFLGYVAKLAPEGKASLATGGALAVTFFGTVVWAPLFGLLADVSGSYRIAFLGLCVPLLVAVSLLLRDARSR